MPASAHKSSKFLMVLWLVFFHVPIGVGCLILTHRLTTVLMYQRAVANSQLHSRQQSYTRQMLTRLIQDIKAFQQQNGILPEKLTTADFPEFAESWKPIDAHGRPLDSWNRPFQYVVKESEPELFSLGQDGLPGGVGMDADLYADGRNDTFAVPTLEQFLAEPWEFIEGPGVIHIANLMSLFALMVYLMGVRKVVDSALAWIFRKARRRSSSNSVDSASETEPAP